MRLVQGDKQQANATMANGSTSAHSSSLPQIETWCAEWNQILPAQALKVSSLGVPQVAAQLGRMGSIDYQSINAYHRAAPKAVLALNCVLAAVGIETFQHSF